MNVSAFRTPLSVIASTFLYLAAGAGSALAADSAGKSESAKAEKIARGKYLVTVGACNDCHTPFKMGPEGPEPDMDLMLSGHPAALKILSAPQLPPEPWAAMSSGTNTAWAGPWGVSFTANLTPDRETGLGKWNLRTFSDTIRTGRHMGRGRPILPPMPYPMYRNWTDPDMEAVFTYLQSIPAISNRVPEPLPPLASEVTGLQ